MLRGRERARAVVDLDAIRHNVTVLRRALSPAAALCVVVKADGYGHGAVPVARAALESGAAWLAVATAEEAEEVRESGIKAPLLVLGPLTGEGLSRAVAAGAEVVVWSRPFASAACRAGASVHLKYDSGMGRLGVDERTTLELAEETVGGGGRLVGLMSHLATADEDDRTFLDDQVARFVHLEQQLRARSPGLVAHIANSAAILREPQAHRDMARAGVAVYGLDPANHSPDTWGLRPAMRWTSYLAGERIVEPGGTVGYGRRFRATERTRIGIVPLGYADGVRRALTNRGEVLIAGRRCPITGTISMDQLTVTLPWDACAPGDEVVLIGTSGRRRILSEEVGHVLDTINYEVVCGVSKRTARTYVEGRSTE